MLMRAIATDTDHRTHEGDVRSVNAQYEKYGIPFLAFTDGTDSPARLWVRHYTFVHEYSWKNDGGWHTHNALENAITEARYEAQKVGLWDFETMLVEKLPCDAREEHYPDICYHYRVTLTFPEES